MLAGTHFLHWKTLECVHMLELFMKSCSPWEKLLPHTAAGEECEQEGVAKMRCYGLTIAPIPHPPSLLGKVEESGVWLSLRRRVVKRRF